MFVIIFFVVINVVFFVLSVWIKFVSIVVIVLLFWRLIMDWSLLWVELSFGIVNLRIFFFLCKLLSCLVVVCLVCVFVFSWVLIFVSFVFLVDFSVWFWVIIELSFWRVDWVVVKVFFSGVKVVFFLVVSDFVWVSFVVNVGGFVFSILICWLLVVF